MRRSYAAAALLVLVAGCSSTPDEPPRPDPTPTRTPTAVEPVGCVDPAEATHADLSAGTAVALRFCPVEDDAALVSSAVLQDGAAALVAQWSARLVNASRIRGCPSGQSAFRIQVQYDDGSLAQLSSGTAGCPAALATGGKLGVGDPRAVYSELATALAGPPADGDVAAQLDCPDLTEASGREPVPDGPLLEGRAVAGVACRAGAPVVRLTTDQAEELRLAGGGGVDRPGGGSIGYPRDDSPLEWGVTLADASGTTVSFAVTGDQHLVHLLTPDGPRLVGKAGEWLLSLLPGGG